MPQQSGRNLGKKYKKLTGDELVTPESEARGAKFVNWYSAARVKFLRKRVRDLDDEIANEAMLQMYNDIVYKGLCVKNYFSYYLRAYHTMRLKYAIEFGKRAAKHISVEDSEVENLTAPEFDSEFYEQCADDLCAELMNYVRDNYTAREISLFEIYTGLHPDVSYESMGVMLGISASLISNTISAIKKDLRLKYAEKRLTLLSLL
jgi:hypothetical protein